MLIKSRHKRHILHNPCISLRYDEKKNTKKKNIKITAGDKILGGQVDEKSFSTNFEEILFQFMAFQ